VNYDLKQVRRLALNQYSLEWSGIHGVSHWQRVQENGLKLADTNGADLDIVTLFALLHDCCRQNDGRDIDHGPRAAEFVETLIGRQIQGDSQLLELLLTAIRDHTRVIHTDDMTVGTCWDADRLDIGRIGRMPDKRFFNTDAARDDALIGWAYRRSRSG